MEKIEYQRIYERESFFWWFVGRRHILEEALRRIISTITKDLDILDIGCGAGGNILFLKKFGRVTGLDVSEEALKFSQDKGFSKLLLGKAEALPVPDKSFNIVSILDCIEHIDDDMKALHECERVLKKDGVLLLTVPAHRWLWSRHDEALHHKKRYTKSELISKIEVAGFVVQEISHFVIPAIPFLLFQKSMCRIKKVFYPRRKEIIDTYDVLLPSFLNKSLILWLNFENLIIKKISIPFGSSILLVAKIDYEFTYEL